MGWPSTITLRRPPPDLVYTPIDVTSYTINAQTGAISFTAAPATSSAVTADYKYGHDFVAAAATTTVSFTLNNVPIIPGSGLTVYADGVSKTLGSDYSVDYDTGVVTFNSAPGSGVRVDATYTYYVVDGIVLTLANAAGGQPVDLTGGKTILAYRDSDSLASNITNYTLTKRGSADADNLLEEGEIFEIKVDVSTYGLTVYDEFAIDVTPASGSALVISRSIPSNIKTRMDLG